MADAGLNEARDRAGGSRAVWVRGTTARGGKREKTQRWLEASCSPHGDERWPPHLDSVHTVDQAEAGEAVAELTEPHEGLREACDERKSSDTFGATFRYLGGGSGGQGGWGGLIRVVRSCVPCLVRSRARIWPGVVVLASRFEDETIWILILHPQQTPS